MTSQDRASHIIKLKNGTLKYTLRLWQRAIVDVGESFSNKWTCIGLTCNIYTNNANTENKYLYLSNIQPKTISKHRNRPS